MDWEMEYPRGTIEHPVVNSRLGFMYRKISIHPTQLTYWLMIPEFESEMIFKMDNSETIDDASVYEVMKVIYFKWECLRNISPKKPDFNYGLARRGIRQIEKALQANQK